MGDGIAQVIAVVAWKSQQSFLTWLGLRRDQFLKAKYAVPFRLIHFCHDVLCSLNEGPQHHFTQQAVSLAAKSGYDLVNAHVTHTCDKGSYCLDNFMPAVRSTRLLLSGSSQVTLGSL